MTFGQRLSILRKEKGLTQSQLAEVLGVSRGTIGMYEIDKRDPDTSTLEKLSNYFNVSVDYLLGRTDIKNPSDYIHKAVEDDPELAEFWEEMKERESLQILFKQVKQLDDKDIKQIIRIIKAIEDEENKE
ncbi:helix-turn-helix domain-containing protein [Thermotalea metallivorans]|uniref:HTH-type transcriptional regulator ImmR n=1 Tax=Thermotalea metallivorans TaxID=520762 RepID=A0A140KZV4_9FIRM|nr:helix-turn-helix transcriptional regulator [Thermotalea metallivorans]KXG73829.1 HTH-type transcriptional regulator ImmR [Thermotalea metallivorans]